MKSTLVVGLWGDSVAVGVLDVTIGEVLLDRVSGRRLVVGFIVVVGGVPTATIIHRNFGLNI